jgi:hypothetical protein
MEAMPSFFENDSKGPLKEAEVETKFSIWSNTKLELSSCLLFEK